MARGTPEIRYAEVDRESKETRVHVVLDLDGGSRQDVATGFSAFDRLLSLFAAEAQFDLGLSVDAHESVDDHVVLRDAGLALGKALRDALSESDPVNQLADCVVVKADARVLAALDIHGKAGAFVTLPSEREMIGDVASQSLSLFLSSLAHAGGITLHIVKQAGENDQHVFEAAFKGLGLVLYHGTQLQNRVNSNSPKRS